jgi:hypothetical protein
MMTLQEQLNGEKAKAAAMITAAVAAAMTSGCCPCRPALLLIKTQ